MELSGFVMVGRREAKRLEDAGEFDLADELHRDLWAARHELRRIREALGE